MKKAKIMLTAIAVLAIVGGALAFKAKNRGQLLFITTTPTATICDVPTQVYKTTITDVGFLSTISTTPVPVAECTTFVTVE